VFESNGNISLPHFQNFYRAGIDGTLFGAPLPARGAPTPGSGHRATFHTGGVVTPR